MLTKWLGMSMAVALLSLPGCTDPVQVGPEEEPGTLESEVVASLLGTYRVDVASVGRVSLLVLKTDHTFHREMIVECFRAPCNPQALDGTYRTATSDGKRYVRLYQNGLLVESYEYVADGIRLQLRRTGTATWYGLTHQPVAWCNAAATCGLQGTPHLVCGGGAWHCAASSCSWSCSGQNACQRAGGSCVGLAPASCPSGEVASANLFSCGGGLGVECCMPRPACTPLCQHVGARTEGWYDSCTGSLICRKVCGGSSAYCGAVGSRSEGWYGTVVASGCGGSDLIRWDDCSP